MESCTGCVHVLNSTTFEPFIESMGVVLLAALMLPVSRRSQLLVPQFHKISAGLNNSETAFAQINALDTGSLLAPYWITRWPSLVLFQGLHQYRKYQGAFREDEIAAYLNDFLHFDVLTTVTAESIIAFKEHDGISVIGYFAPEDNEHMRIMENLAHSMYPHYIFGATSDVDLARSEGIAVVPSIAMYRKPGEERIVLPFTEDVKQMSRSLRKAALPLVIDLAFETHENFLDLGQPFGYVFTEPSKNRTESEAMIAPVAQKYHANIQLSIADSRDLADIAGDLHLELNQPLKFAIREPDDNLRYPMNETSGNFVSSITDFIEEYLKGNLKPTIKSEPILKNWTDALVKVVGLNYHEIVMDEKKDVLVTYCITPCGPCERLQPTILTLAEVYRANPRLRGLVTIAKVLYDENDTGERDLRAFPTIKLFPASDKRNPAQFKGNMTFDDLVDFVRDRGTHGADLRDSDRDPAEITERSKEYVVQDACSYDTGGCETALGSEVSGQPQRLGSNGVSITLLERVEL